MINKKVQSLRKLRSVPFLFLSKKAISPVVATALLLIVAVLAVIGFQN